MLNQKLNNIRDEDDEITKSQNSLIVLIFQKLNEDVSQKYYSDELKYKKESNDMRKNIEEIKNDIKELKELKGIIEKLALSVDKIKKKLNLKSLYFHLVY